MANEAVKNHADAMAAIRDLLRPFPPADRMVMLAGALGNSLCELGPNPNRHSAVGMLGTAIEMALDMVSRNFPPLPDPDEAQTPYQH